MIAQKMARLFNTFLSASLIVLLYGCSTTEAGDAVLNEDRLAASYFQEDAQWYKDNIPFFECSDQQLEQVYYYRWKMYKAHIRNTGQDSFVITEFINHMPWDREPFCTINAASMHHIYEGRWLRDSRYMNGYINYLLRDGGNNRHYSESISDAAYARYLVNADSSFLMTQLDSMKQMYNEWSDHYDADKNLYYIPAMPDATEYTIASIDASGGTGGFDDGEAYRPTINSYMYANAKAIARVASMKGDETTTKEYLQKAASLKLHVEQDLWNDSLLHFCDRFKVSNQYVHYWNFIRGRELAGMAPWYFDLPENNGRYNAAWNHVFDTAELLGPFGFRTNEPSYQYYFKLLAFYGGKPSSQWNGPSWPYQSSQALTGLANFLNDYTQHNVSPSDYLKLLRLFARQHYLPDGKINLVENYDPNHGGPIVFWYWSNHYNHSTFNNLIITGLCGIRPSEGDTLTVHPLVDSSIHYFCLQHVLYHGHELTVIYDRNGDHYNLGKGTVVWVDGKKTAVAADGEKCRVFVGPPVIQHAVTSSINYALNIGRKGYPKPSGSVNHTPDTALYQVIDGKIWYFPEVTNQWNTIGSATSDDWFSVDFGRPRQVFRVKIYPVADGKNVEAPEQFSIQFLQGDKWVPVNVKSSNPAKPLGNTVNVFDFDPVSTNAIRIYFIHRGKQIAISEIECY
jgi:hypothetical protein